MYGMVVWALLVLAGTIGFGYIILVLAAKESGKTKLVGQIIGWVIIILALVLFSYGLYKCQVMCGKGMSGCPMMGKGGMMMEKGKMMDKCEMGGKMMMPGKHIAK